MCIETEQGRGVWSSYIYIITFQSFISRRCPPPEPRTNGKRRIIPLKSLKKYISEQIRPFFSFPIAKIPFPLFFCPPSTVRIVDCSFFCHILHHPNPFTSFMHPPLPPSPNIYDWLGVAWWGRNHETGMNDWGVRENIDLLIFVSQQQQQQQQQ